MDFIYSFIFISNIWLKHFFIFFFLQPCDNQLDHFSFILGWIHFVLNFQLIHSPIIHMDLQIVVLFIFATLNLCHINSGYVLDARECLLIQYYLTN